MGTIFIKVIEMSIAAAFLMAAVILLRFPLKKAPKWFMGVLWAIVALRLALPFQIETKLGVMPNFAGVIEGYFNESGITNAATSVTNHIYTPDSNVGYVAEFEPNTSVDADEEIIEYLPNEEIITTTIADGSMSNLTDRKDLFIRLQMIWLFGLMVVIAYAVFSYISIWKKTRASIKMGGNDRVFICDEIDTPFILGIIRPSIYLPSGLDDETRRNVLAHEKAHIRRGDHLRKQFGFVLLAVHWFNPLVWVSYMLFCKDIELACDERVISRMSLDEKKSYANSLLLCSTHQKLILAYPLAFGEVGVGTRVKQIFNYKKPTFWLLVLLVMISGALSACFLTSSADTDGAAQDADIHVTMPNAESDASEQTSEDAESNSSSHVFKSTPQDALLGQWGTCFIDRNVDGIIENSTEFVQKKLISEGVLSMDEDGTYFGWSSPWPDSLSDNKGQPISVSYFLNDEEKTEAVVHYYATDSEPHVYVWIEKIKVGQDENGDYKVTEEYLDMYDSIDTFKDLEDAYFSHSMDNEAIDYTKNGFGEYLNDHAKTDPDGLYSMYFDPVESAKYLLNLSDDESKVVVAKSEDKDNGTVVSIKFVKESKFMDILMVKPWGEDGIFVPQMKMPAGLYGERNYELLDDTTGSLSDDETSYQIADDSENDYLAGNEGPGNLLYTEETEAKIGTVPFSDDTSYFEDIHKDKSTVDGYYKEVDPDGDKKKEKEKVIDLED
ncbi:M56 family metallopeptidase [Butyrivibrio sp. FC2001]|uniref:M56 family metallopeptidase n=1 Tax=Butyrivibrio sp. FC2001 TaxID=1280671 RepID=UPI0003FFF221|nr:M56 family metallopeptidase [Butyrivibrio sp. FC2001]